MATVYEGLGFPKIVFNDTTYHVLPEPVGPAKDGLRIYGFDIFTRDQYWSELGKRNNIGKKFIFDANLKWVSLPKTSLKKLWKAQVEKDFTFILNIDKPEINFKCEVASLKYKFFEGIPGHRAGYTVELRLRGSELLSISGYSSEITGEGFGFGWGETVEGQSP